MERWVYEGGDEYTWAAMGVCGRDQMGVRRGDGEWVCVGGGGIHGEMLYT